VHLRLHQESDVAELDCEPIVAVEPRMRVGQRLERHAVVVLVARQVEQAQELGLRRQMLPE